MSLGSELNVRGKQLLKRKLRMVHRLCLLYGHPIPDRYFQICLNCKAHEMITHIEVSEQLCLAVPFKASRVLASCLQE